MLQGPASNSNGVGFESHIRTGLTPNESGIRSGLTPGGSGSIFAAPSSAMFQFVGSGGATPGTMEFHKTAIAAARKSQPPLNTSHQISVKPEENASGLNNEHDQQKPRQHSDPYHGSDPAHNAASGLFLLAQAQHQQGDTNAVGTGYQGGNQLPSGMPVSNGGPIENSSPSLAKRAVVNSANNAAMSSAVNRSVSGGSMANSVRGMSEISDDFSDSGGEGEMQNLNTNSGSRNTRARKGKNSGPTTARRKAEDQSPGGGRSQQNKKTKGNQGQSVSGGSDDGNDGMDMDDNQTGKDGKKMTDEEKRKNFLERNR